MVRLRGLVLTSLAVVFGHALPAQESDKAVTLTVTEDSGRYVLTVPVSRLVMAIPKGSLRIAAAASGGALASPRYFSFEDDSLPLSISGWFESADGFSDIQAFWRQETAAWKQHHAPEPRNVSFVKVGHWDAVVYDLRIPIAKDTEIRAHWVAAGTWIDIHLSLAGDEPEPELRRKLRAVLESIRVTEKTP